MQAKTGVTGVLEFEDEGMRDTTTIAVAAAAAFFLLSELSRWGAFDSVATQATTLLRPAPTAVAKPPGEKCMRPRATLIVVASEPCATPHAALAAADD